MKRKTRRVALALLVCGFGTLTQVGACVSSALNIGAGTIDFCTLIGNNCTLGPIAFCGNRTTNADDLLIDCQDPGP